MLTKETKIIDTLFIILVIFINPIRLFADVIIPMTSKNGVFYIPCKINGTSHEFIFDTGAADVCISRTLANHLFHNGIIQQSDILGHGMAQVADGRTVTHDIINIRTFCIGSRTLTNVRAIIIEGQNTPLLLGQSALSKLGQYHIHGRNLIIQEVKTNHIGTSTKEQEIIQEALQLYYHGNKHQAVNILFPKWREGLLSNTQKLVLMDAYNQTTYTNGFNDRVEALELLHDINVDNEIISTFGLDKYYIICAEAYLGANDNINAETAYRKAFYNCTNPLTQAQVLYNIGSIISDVTSTFKQKKAYNIYWESMEYLTKALNHELGTAYSPTELMDNCLITNLRIFSLMSDDLRDVAEKLTYDILFTCMTIEDIDYVTYNEALSNLISAGNKYAEKIKHRY